MLLSYQECIEKYGTDYKIKKSVQDGELFVMEKGIYSDKRYVSELEIISKKYPNAILTLNSAFYYYGLTDTIPSFYHVATPKNARKISDARVKQIYENSEAFDMGKTIINYEGIDILIYNKERLLVELIRNKHKFSFDLYKELINNYRKIIHELDISVITEYVYELPKKKMVMEIIRREVLQLINIQKMVAQATENGYQGDNASAKVCQDIVLKALASGPFSRNVTIKGGVVMRSCL